MTLLEEGDGTMRRSSTIVLALFAIPMTHGSGNAQVSLFTAPLQSNSSATQIICRASNTDTLAQVVTLQYRDAFNGSGSSTQVFALLAGETAELAGAAGYVYCDASVNTNAIADKFLLSIHVRNGSDEATGALPGARMLTGAGTVQRTPSLEAVNGNLVCHVVNVATTSQTVTTKILDDAGAVLVTQTNTLGSMAGVAVTATGPVAGRCEVTAATNGLAKDLRVALFENQGGQLFSSRAPLSGALRP